jgi:hypothetical protein
VGVEAGWRGNPRIQLEIFQLSQCVYTSQYGIKVRSCFYVLLRAKMQRILEQHYAIKFCVKLGKSGSKTLQLLRTVYVDAVLTSGDTRR